MSDCEELVGVHMFFGLDIAGTSRNHRIIDFI